MNKYQKLIQNSIIFAIGNLGSKLITFILVPFYTFHLSTSEYGFVDLISSTINLFLPIVSLCLFDAVLRFVLDRNQDKAKVLSSSFFISIFSILIFLIVGMSLVYLSFLSKIWLYFLIILSMQIVQTIFAQFVRGIGMVKIYSVNSIIFTLSVCLFSFITLSHFKMGINGYFLSQILGYLVSIIFFVISAPIISNIKFSKNDFFLTKELIKFSIPLIPTNISWWFVNGSSRYFIVLFMNTSANGIFAVASKIPGFLNMITGMFTQAWQISAVEENDSDNKEKFYGNIFDIYYFILMLSCLLMLIVLKWAIIIFISPSFSESWKLIPFLLLAAIFSSLSAFIGQIYVVEKKTAGMFKTSIFPAVSTILANLLLINFYGLLGATIAQLVGWFFAFLYRIYDTRKFLKFPINKLKFILGLIIYGLAIIVLFIYEGWILILAEIFINILFIIINIDLLKKFSSLILKK